MGIEYWSSSARNKAENQNLFPSSCVNHRLDPICGGMKVENQNLSLGRIQPLLISTPPVKEILYRIEMLRVWMELWIRAQVSRPTLTTSSHMRRAEER